MPVRSKLEGLAFGRWNVLSYAGLVGKNASWNCLCSCGTERVVLGFLLKNGDSTSCGCYYEEIKNLPRTHGMSKTRPHGIWGSMKNRCNSEDFKDCGIRGITYTTDWETFEGFWKDMEEGYADDLELDRIDVNGNYTKENCRWVSKSTQQYNRRKSKLNTSGYTGVSYYSSRDSWEAYIKVDKRLIKLGYFQTAEAAYAARQAAEMKYFGYLKEGRE